MDILLCVICFKIRSNLKVGRSTRMDCIYQSFDNYYIIFCLFFYVPMFKYSHDIIITIILFSIHSCLTIIIVYFC